MIIHASGMKYAQIFQLKIKQTTDLVMDSKKLVIFLFVILLLNLRVTFYSVFYFRFGLRPSTLFMYFLLRCLVVSTFNYVTMIYFIIVCHGYGVFLSCGTVNNIVIFFQQNYNSFGKYIISYNYLVFF